jgi:hypothetical protein
MIHRADPHRVEELYVADASPGTTQNLVAEDWERRATASLDAVDQSLSVLPEEVRTALAPLIAEARTGVENNEPEPYPSRA